MHICFTPSTDVHAPIIVGCYENTILTAEAREIDITYQGLITEGLKAHTFTGKIGVHACLMTLQAQQVVHVIVIGLGKEADMTEHELTIIGGSLFGVLQNLAHPEVVVQMAELSTSHNQLRHPLSHVALGLRLRSWQYQDLKTTSRIPPLKVEKITFISDDIETKTAFVEAEKVVEGIFFTRELVTLLPNILYPQSMAERLKAELEPLGVEVEILEIDALKQLGMGALLGVAQGSAFAPYVVVMQWKGADASVQPVAFLGKGVTFDSGGISTKPSAGMEDMKYDMGGAGVVAGLMKALAKRQAKANIIGVVGLVENMPSGSAQRPSDVVKTMSGLTVEVLNTDAEGRLVLADILRYTQNRFKPQFMINLATLTGAITIALGDLYAGLFSNNDDLCDKLTACGQHVNERLWRLPVGQEYDKALQSQIADLQNISGGRKAGSITAAQFLNRFVNNAPWAHLDIAAVTWAEKNLDLCAEGATGFGVRLLNRLVQEHYES